MTAPVGGEEPPVPPPELDFPPGDILPMDVQQEHEEEPPLLPLEPPLLPMEPPLLPLEPVEPGGYKCLALLRIWIRPDSD